MNKLSISTDFPIDCMIWILMVIIGIISAIAGNFRKIQKLPFAFPILIV